MSKFGPVFSVGTVNVVLKIIVLSTVAVAGELVSHCLRLLTGLRLAGDGKAPFSFSSDGEVFKFFKTLRRFGSASCLGLLSVSLLALAILPAEIASDFGVDSSESCSPTRTETHGLCSMSISAFNSFSKQLSTALLIEDLKWDSNDLVNVPIRQGFRKDSDGSEYLGSWVERNTSLPITIEGCYVDEYRLIPSGQLTFGASNLMKGEGPALLRVDSPIGSFIGQGGVFFNYEVCSSFLVVEHANGINDSSSATIVEYHNSAHLRSIIRNKDGTSKDWYSSRTPIIVKSKTKAPLLMYKVGCRQASMYGNQFSLGMFAYRYAQLARSAKRNRLPVINITKNGFRIQAPKPLDAANVVKATIASKIIEPVSCKGETFLYTKCGTFDMKMGYPLIFVTSMLVLISIALEIRKRITKKIIKTPLSESAWARFALKLCSKERVICVIGSEEYNTKYKQYGERPLMGEFVKTCENESEEFFLRHITFTRAHDGLPDSPVSRANSILRSYSRPESSGRYTDPSSLPYTSETLSRYTIDSQSHNRAETDSWRSDSQT